MRTTANNTVEKRPQGRPPLPIDEKRLPLRFYPKIALIRRFEEAGRERGYTTEQLITNFGEVVIERGLDSLEHDQTLPAQYGTNLDHAVTYPTIQE